jgi:hypothetical protein
MGDGGRRVYKSMISTSLAALASKRHTPRSLSFIPASPRFLTWSTETTTATRTSDLPTRSHHHATDSATIQMALLRRMYLQAFRLDGYLLIIR